MGALDIRRRGIEERTGGEEQRPGFDGQYGAARHAALVGSAPVAFGQPVIGFLAQFEDIIERLGERRTAHRDFGIGRRGERLADDGQTAVAVEHAHVAIGYQRQSLGLDVVLLLGSHVGHPVDILVHGPAMTDVGPVVAEVVRPSIGTVGSVDIQTGIDNHVGPVPGVSARDLAADGSERTVAYAPSARQTVEQNLAVTGHQGTFRILGRPVNFVQIDGSGRVGHLQEGILTAGHPQRHGHEQCYECFFHCDSSIEH